MEDPVIRLPKYARGLQLVRIGVLMMLGQLAISIIAVGKALAGSDPNSAIEWMKYTMWANLAATGAMLLGALLAVPDFIRTKVPLRPLITASIGFAIALLMLLWTYFTLLDFIAILEHPFRGGSFDESLDESLDGLMEATKKLQMMDFVAMVKDIGYAIGLLAIVRSIRETAVANEHDGLRATADYVGRLLAKLVALDIGYQLLHRIAATVPFIALVALVAAIFVFGYWIYSHFKLQKFLGAAAILVNEPHHVPMARVVSTSDTAPAAAPVVPKPRPSAPSGSLPRVAPAARPDTAPGAFADLPSTPSQPVIVAAEIRSAPAPRAETAPGAATDEPKFLR